MKYGVRIYIYEPCLREPRASALGFLFYGYFPARAFFSRSKAPAPRLATNISAAP
jgi:hypothetical protein